MPKISKNLLNLKTTKKNFATNFDKQLKLKEFVYLKQQFKPFHIAIKILNDYLPTLLIRASVARIQPCLNCCSENL